MIVPLSEEMRVSRTTGTEEIFIRTEMVQEIVGRRTFDEDLSHVAHVEEADRLAHGQMFFDDARILEGHLPSAELDEARAGRSMPNHPRACATPSESAMRKRLKDFLPAKLIPTRLVARGHHGYFRELRYELSALFFALGSSARSSPSPNTCRDTESGLAEIDSPCGRRVRRVGGVLGFLAVLAGGFYFVDTIRKEREFERLISTTSKSLFVKKHAADRGAHVRPSAVGV